MGSYQRDWAEAAEIRIANLIATPPEKMPDDSDAKVALLIREQIMEDYPNAQILSSEHTGDKDYSVPGDAKFVIGYKTSEKHATFVNIETKYVELKVSQEDGEGTKGNSGQGFFSTRVDSSIPAYADFDAVNTLKRFNIVKDHLGLLPGSKAEYEKVLKEAKDAKIAQWPSLHAAISEATNPTKAKYAARVVKDLNKLLATDEGKKKINQMVKEVFDGNNTCKPSDEDTKKCSYYVVVKRYEQDDQTQEIKDFEICAHGEVVKAKASGYQIQLLNSEGKTVLNFATHWKNICQGGKTPCFNVFVGTALK